MATLVITIVTPNTVADVTDQLLGVGTITADPNAQDRVARLVACYWFMSAQRKFLEGLILVLILLLDHRLYMFCSNRNI